MSEYPKHLEGINYELSDGSTAEGYSNAKKQQNKINMSKANFTAVYKRGVQIGPEDWRADYVTKQISADTTIGELQEWYADANNGIPMNITINEERTSQ